MSSTQKRKGTTNACPQRSTKDTIYKAPTQGLQHVIFEYGEWMKPGIFKSMMESLAEHMANIPKNGGPEAARAMKKQKKPMYEAPEEAENGTKRAN
jgi:hypothetical protein